MTQVVQSLDTNENVLNVAKTRQRCTNKNRFGVIFDIFNTFASKKKVFQHILFMSAEHTLLSPSLQSSPVNVLPAPFTLFLADP